MTYLTKLRPLGEYFATRLSIVDCRPAGDVVLRSASVVSITDLSFTCSHIQLTINYNCKCELSQGSHQATKIKFPDIPGRFLKIPYGARGVYHFSGRLHLPHTDTLPSPFNASISFFTPILRHVLTTAVFK